MYVNTRLNHVDQANKDAFTYNTSNVTEIDNDDEMHALVER